MLENKKKCRVFSETISFVREKFVSQFYKQKRCFIAQFCFAHILFYEIGGKSYVSLLLVFDVFASLHSSHNSNFYNAHETETELSLKPVINSGHKK